ncbi:MAG: hypothetical protein FWE08_06050 [Oscillospiraceae bacterium]|nr:hypothetical protein [Oscillospiraceae bacterium]
MSRANKPWLPEEEEYLAEHWGYSPVPSLSKALGRSKNAIMCRVHKLGLPPFLESGDYITLNQLTIAVTGSSTNYSYKMESWVKKRGLPVHNKRKNRSTWRVVYLNEFWKWAEKNRSFIDFSKMEPLALGEEPAWVSEQRSKDFRAFAVQRKDPWTTEDDDKLKSLLKMHRYGYAELSKMLRRSAGAIQRRTADLGLRERPVKADNRSHEWTDKCYRILADGIRAGDSYTLIGEAVGRSGKAVRGKVYYEYLTENADKVRAMLGSGEWGAGAPDPTVKQAVVLSKTRTATLKELSQLAGILAYRRNELGYEPYWQRHMCVKWHDIKGCTAGCDNCDTCTEFERIRPQYCARCGITFYERQKATFCAPCRTARRKSHQRKYAVMAARGGR